MLSITILPFHFDLLLHLSFLCKFLLNLIDSFIHFFQICRYLAHTAFEVSLLLLVERSELIFTPRTQVNILHIFQRVHHVSVNTVHSFGFGGEGKERIDKAAMKVELFQRTGAAHLGGLFRGDYGEGMMSKLGKTKGREWILT